MPHAPLVSYEPLLIIHRPISVKVTFLPYKRMPVRYIFADSQTIPNEPKTSKIIDAINSQAGTPRAMRKGMMIGENNGMSEDQNAKPLLGASIMAVRIKIEIMMGSDTGNVSDWLSLSSFTAEPTAANKAAYIM